MLVTMCVKVRWPIAFVSEGYNRLVEAIFIAALQTVDFVITLTEILRYTNASSCWSIRSKNVNLQTK